MALYDRLPDHAIRLLRIRRNDRTAVQYDLSTHNLDEAVKLNFSALSYTWGTCQHIEPRITSPDGIISCNRVEITSGGQRNVICGGEQVKITGNLLDFLEACDIQGYLWIDALCIDQGNNGEKSHQVNLMSQIYEKATRVYVWLGPEDEWTEDGLEMVEQLASRHSAKFNSEDVLFVNARTSGQRKWQALARLFARTWFSRAWIVQEVVLAQECIILCGKQSIKWETLVKASQLLAKTHWSSRLKASSKEAKIKESWHTAPARLAATRDAWNKKHAESFLYALIRARPFKCENPRDKVFSQLGLGRTIFFPNYGFTVSQAYIGAAIHIILQADSLLILTCVEGREFQTPEFDLPSWVPDWSRCDFLGLRITGYEHFNAHGGRSKYANVRLSNGKTVLDVQAYRIDTIEETFETKKEFHKNPGSSKLWTSIDKLSPWRRTRNGILTPKEAVWRTLSTNREGGSSDEGAKYPASEEMGMSFTKWIEWRDALHEGNADPSSLEKLENDASRFELHYSRAMIQRLFRTRGEYFGMGPPSLRKGDSIWIVAGCRVPIILRQEDGSAHYSLIGGSYVHCFMDGEAVKDHEGRNLDVNFEIISIE
ncbi:hypothetical protein E8E13_004425 [Curvularia kusanoi]|uniref:Heterokaryon incompatibility domain-containing protein n=1 Tax=Curvularia kusanoi TaxID=90978 RepID=A0A9P4T792_CURKU|nr:hypothetical protein E8E13_004425 [Curvularia kusanoi]